MLLELSATNTLVWPRSIPTELTSLIGRDAAAAAARDLLQDGGIRLLTLTGPGGVGKTRLAMRVARDAAAAFPNGVVFVSLAPLQDAALVPAAIADRLEVQESGIRSLVEDLIARLGDDQILLVLDNFEHLLDAVPLVTELLLGCPALKVLATSRRRLGHSGEHEYPVPPLAVADPRQRATVAELTRIPAIQLFVARAQAAAPSFKLTEANGQQVAEICQRLDGLPLAIELAAPRTRLLSPAALLSRLTNSLQLLTDGPRDVPERLQTMRQAIAWSYDLLDPAAQTLLRRLAVFVGVFSPEAAEAVARRPHSGAPPANLRNAFPAAAMFAELVALADESLLHASQQPGGGRRFGMLETVREYALERLVEAGEEAEARRRHAEYCLSLVEHDDLGQYMPQEWLDRQQTELSNLRAALAWSLTQDPEMALRLAGALRRFWSQRGYWSEGRGWLERALVAAPDAPPEVRAAALAGAGTMADEQSDFANARRCFEEGLALAQQIGDQLLAARFMRSLGIVASNQNELDRAAELFEEALVRLRALQNQAAIGRCLNDLGLVAERRGDYERAIPFYEEALSLARATGDETFAALVLSNLAGATLEAGDLVRGEPLTEEALAQCRLLGDRYGIASNLHNLADSVRRRGDVAGAWERYRESLIISHELGQFSLLTQTLGRIADILAMSDMTRPAVHILGAAAALRRQIDAELFPHEEKDVAATIATTRAALSEEAFQAAWEAGEALSPDQAVAAVLALPLPPAIAEQQARRLRAQEIGLTPREVQVLHLVAKGLADKEIAVILTIKRRTVLKHLDALRAKLHSPSRTAAVAAAHEAGLL